MKKLNFLISIFILFITSLNARAFDVGYHNLKISGNFVIIDWSSYDLDFLNEACSDYEKCYSITTREVKDVLDQIKAGKNYDEIFVLKPIINKINKLSSSNYNNASRHLKNLLSKVKSTLKKNNSEIIFNYYVLGKADKVFEQYGVDITIDELKNMSSEEINFYTKEVKEELNIKNNYYPISDEMGIKLKSFKFSKTQDGVPFLYLRGDIFFFYQKRIKIVEMIYYASEYDNNIFALDAVCFANCSKLKSKFDKITNDSFVNKVSLDKTKKFNNNDLVDQLKQLNELYKSGVLTKEEFEKAKKRILN